MSTRLLIVVLLTVGLLSAWPTAATPPTSPSLLRVALLLRPEVCHRLDRISDQVGKPNPDGTPGDPYRSFGGRRSHCTFDSGLMLPNGTFAFPGLAPGRYPYLCRIHPIMHGVITVTDMATFPSQL